MEGIFDLANTIRMVDDMEIIEKFVGRKGRFVGDMVHIKISDLANAIKKRAPIGDKNDG